MEETRLTVRVPRDLLESVKRYAAENNTTFTDESALLTKAATRSS
jgi:predicted DNA binding CopG/RHH family protein